MWMIWAAWIVMKRSLREYLLKESNMRMIMKSAIMRSKRQTNNLKLLDSYIKMQEAITPQCQVKLQMFQYLSKILQRSLLSGKAISQHRNSYQVGHRIIHSWAEWTKGMILTWIIWNTVITKTVQFTWKIFSPHQTKTLSFQKSVKPHKNQHLSFSIENLWTKFDLRTRATNSSTLAQQLPSLLLEDPNLIQE